MLITIPHFDRRATMAAGLAIAGGNQPTVEIDLNALTATQREILAANCNFYDRSTSTSLSVSIPTVAGLIAAIDKHIVDRAAKLAAYRQALVTQTQAFLAAELIPVELDLYSNGHRIGRYTGNKLPDVSRYVSAPWTNFDDQEAEAELKAFRSAREQAEAKLEAANAAAAAAARPQLEQADAARLQRQVDKENAAVAERAAWIAEHGSARLQRLVAEKIEHDAVYEDERLLRERPDWEWEPKKMYLDEPRNAPMEALALLDEARKTEPAAELKYYKVYRKADEDEDEYHVVDDDGDILIERGYVAAADFLGGSIVSKVRHLLPV